MPYRHAHWYLLALFPLAALAFWPGYLSQARTAGFEFHAHGITASLWLAMLAWQSWSIHRGSIAMHRLAGRSSLILFPLFLAGGITIFIGMAQRFAGAVSPFHTLYAPRLAWLDVVAVTGMIAFYFLALKWRRKVQIHSRYMLATVIFLLPPIFARLSPMLPPFAITPTDLSNFVGGLHFANLLAAGIALALAFMPAKHGRPFFVAAALTLLSSVLFATVGTWPSWHRLFAAAAGLPAGPLSLLAMVFGAGVAWAGWIAGKRSAAGAMPLPA